tara:strand:+ start:91 stop:450 length:360 start_codon:yes stop_codon:yes gene_type:complete
LLKTESQFRVFVVALEVFTEEAATVLDHFCACKHRATGWTEDRFSRGVIRCWSSMASTTGPSRNGIDLTRGVESFRIILLDDGRYDTPAFGIGKQCCKAGRKPSWFHERVCIEHTYGFT